MITQENVVAPAERERGGLLLTYSPISKKMHVLFLQTFAHANNSVYPYRVNLARPLPWGNLSNVRPHFND